MAYLHLGVIRISPQIGVGETTDASRQGKNESTGFSS